MAINDGIDHIGPGIRWNIACGFHTDIQFDRCCWKVNGPMFYADIVAANQRTYLPFTQSNFCTIFIAWFTFSFGFDTCYFEGMDAYTKTWIQMAFPVYLIILVVIIIHISEHSTCFASLIGKGNLIATLAILILLAFTKFLQNIIAIFLFAILEHPDKSKVLLWLPDASIKSLGSKHTPLQQS